MGGQGGPWSPTENNCILGICILACSIDLALVFSILSALILGGILFRSVGQPSQHY